MTNLTVYIFTNNETIDRNFFFFKRWWLSRPLLYIFLLTKSFVSLYPCFQFRWKQQNQYREKFSITLEKSRPLKKQLKKSDVVKHLNYQELADFTKFNCRFSLSNFYMNIFVTFPIEIKFEKNTCATIIKFSFFISRNIW